MNNWSKYVQREKKHERDDGWERGWLESGGGNDSTMINDTRKECADMWRQSFQWGGEKEKRGCVDTRGQIEKATTLRGEAKRKRKGLRRHSERETAMTPREQGLC